MDQTGGDLGRHDHEFESVRWIAFDEAQHLLTFETERALVARAAEAVAARRESEGSRATGPRSRRRATVPEVTEAVDTGVHRTPLHRRHEALGAKLIEFGGWLMPVQYSGILEEHRAVRERAGLFDLSHMGELFVTGEDAGAPSPMRS